MFVWFYCVFKFNWLGVMFYISLVLSCCLSLYYSMDVLKNNLDRRMWNKNSDFESSYYNNMVTKDVEVYKRENYVLMVSLTKSAGYAVELFDCPDKGVVETLVYRGGFGSEEELGDFVDSLIEEYSLNDSDLV